MKIIFRCIFLAVTIYAKVIFSNANEFSNKCEDLNNNPTTCVNKNLCSNSTLTGANEPKHCYLVGHEEFVCCQTKSVNLTNISEQRPAVQACHLTFNPRTVGGGSPTKPNEFPYMCALGWKTSTENIFDYKCGGALITADFIVTAAHCAYIFGDSPSVVLPGGHNLTDTKSKHLNVSKVIVHPDYKPDSSYHDIALIQIVDPIEEENTACLWPDNNLKDENLTVIGYGDIEFAGPSSPQLLKAQLLAVSQQKCSTYFSGSPKLLQGITKKQICAGDPEEYRDTCQGDSGGPLIMKESFIDSISGNKTFKHYIVGITSFGIGCVGEPPGVYTRISEYLDWIESVVWPA